ncbi:UNVERIFIED_CONTAM: hypothetical protein PYX00_008816 [Menopon gallinae]|uniref:Ectopic P granules protein 5 homolog n=1 Tax=Menopon gallinae TaxID=328185 RepID=A0AAW2HQF8_9NEOP
MLCPEKSKGPRKNKRKEHAMHRTDIKHIDSEKSKTISDKKDEEDKVSLDNGCEVPVYISVISDNGGCDQNVDLSQSAEKYEGPESLHSVVDRVIDASRVDSLTVNSDNIFSAEVLKVENYSSEVQACPNVIEHECSEIIGDNSKLSDHNILLNEVKTSTGNTIEPSAPVSDFVTPMHVKETEETNLNSLHTSHEKETEINLEQRNIIKFKTELSKETLAPLSEEELSHFYHNSELSQAKIFVDEFIKTEVNNEAKIMHPFYILLSNYLKAKNNLQLSKHKIRELDEKIEKYIGEMWTVWNDIEVSEIGKCADGNAVSVKKNFTVAKFNHEIFEDFRIALLEIRSALFENYKLDSFNCIYYKLKINHYIESILRSCAEFTNLSDTSPISLVQTSSDSYFHNCLSKLRISIGILFLFQRKQRIDMSSSFLEETREWLTDLVSVLIRTGNWKDHLLVLSHILRCPGSVGNWASPFIQFPRSATFSDPFSDPVINHMMTVMSILLQPIDGREDFMNEWKMMSSNEDNCWVMVDSDDEDDESLYLSSPIKENDMVLFLNQIPLKHLFESILGLKNGKLNPEIVTADHLMKVFSFSLDFIRILHTGLQVYSKQRYKQFAKRLGRLIRHIIEYATYELDIFRSKLNQKADNFDRLHILYDNFFLRAAESIYSSRIHGTWQFLAVIPFHRPSRNVILKLYSILQLNDNHTGCNSEINLNDFEEKFQALPESEQFYLLSTFTNMALARDLTELDFIKAVVHQLLHIGFLSSATMDQCYKNVKSLLYNLCDRHSFLMSDILRVQNEYFILQGKCDQSLSVHLWKELPLKNWKPTSTDIEVLSNWLLQPLQSVRNELGRVILTSLNYGFEEELFLPFDTHRTIAFSIMRANVKLSQVQEVSVIRNVSSFVGLQEPEQTFQSWSWNVLLKLHLHLLDQSDFSVKNSLQNLNENLQNIPELTTVRELHGLTEEKNPIACFIALMTTSVGHSVPVIFNEGFLLIEILIRARKYEAAIACMEHMTLMFFECRESLFKCQAFTSVLSQLIKADCSYLNLTKNLKAFETPGPVLLCLENMIQNQINSCEKFRINRAVLIELWIKSLTRLPLWTQESGVIYLLDSLCKITFFNREISCLVRDLFSNLLTDIPSPTESRSSLSSLVNWMNNKTLLPTLLPKAYNGNVPWFFIKAIEIEQGIHETNNYLWIELLKELFMMGDKKTNVDNCLKKACNNLQIQNRTSEVLIIYRLCYQILETNVNHPVIILLWQMFFLLYFQRVPGVVDNGSIGEKFFHGMVNQNLLKKLKQRLQETFDCFNELCSQSDECERREYFLKCAKLFKVFQLWLDETKLHKPNLSVHLLPPHFEPGLFGTIINQDRTPWIQYVDYEQVQSQTKKSVLAWQELKRRRTKNELPKSPSDQNKSMIDRIEEGLTRYECPLPAPPIDIQKYYTSSATGILLSTDSVGSYLQPSFRSILDYADFYTREVGEYVGLCCDMQELVQALYTVKNSSITVRTKCNGYEKVINGVKVSFNCSGPAVITLAFEESEMDKKNHQLFNQCLRNFNRYLQSTLTPPQQNLLFSVVKIEKVIEDLKAEYLIMRSKIGDEKLMLNLRETGTRLFYEFIHSWCEAVSFTPSIERIFENSVNILGQTFMADNAAECGSLLNVINEHPKLIGKIDAYFTPNTCSTQEFIELYAKVKRFSPDIRVKLLSRFRLTEWIKEKRPRFSERSLLISEIGAGLKCFGSNSEEHSELIQLFNSHLQELLMYDFPEHYGEILNLLLEGSESQVLPVSTWFMFINSLVPEGIHFVQGKVDGTVFEPGQNVKKLKVFFTQYATLQKFLSLTDIRETILHLANVFKMDRLKHGLYGLYPKYHHYVEAILIFSGMLSHAYVAETLKLDLGSLSMRIAEQMWPLLRDLYSPWLVPYWSNHEKAQTAKWIQELTDDKCVLLPWLNADNALASYCCCIFIDSIRFILDTLPGTNSLLNHVWFFYVTNYAHMQVKDHVLRVIHKNLLQLPWCTFFPNLQDIEFMVRVVEHFIPMSHSLLGNIFVEVRWTDVVQYYSNQCEVEILGKLHIYLLHLLVKLPCEPSLKQNNEIIVLLTQAKHYSWHLVDSNNYDSVLNWFVMSSDPRIVLMDEQSEYYKLDYLVLQDSAYLRRFFRNIKGIPSDNCH